MIKDIEKYQTHKPRAWKMLKKDFFNLDKGTFDQLFDEAYLEGFIKFELKYDPARDKNNKEFNFLYTIVRRCFIKCHKRDKRENPPGIDIDLMQDNKNALSQPEEDGTWLRETIGGNNLYVDLLEESGLEVSQIRRLSCYHTTDLKRRFWSVTKRLNEHVIRKVMDKDNFPIDDHAVLGPVSDPEPHTRIRQWIILAVPGK